VPEKQLITMDFQDVEIGVLVKFISEITGKNVILDEKVRGKVTVISPTKITIEEAYRSPVDPRSEGVQPRCPRAGDEDRARARGEGIRRAAVDQGGGRSIRHAADTALVHGRELARAGAAAHGLEGRPGERVRRVENTLILIDHRFETSSVSSTSSPSSTSRCRSRGMEIIKLENAYAGTVAATLQAGARVSVRANRG